MTTTPSPQTLDTTPPFAPAELRPLRILSIDDDEGVRGMLQLLLERSGHKIIPASLGQQGCELALNEQPDVIICDVGLPDMSGHEVLNRLRDDYRTRHIPFIFLSGFTDNPAIRRGFAGGATDYLLKPFRLEEINEAIILCRRKLAWLEAIAAQVPA
ncbi:MAG TPA: response regulator [Candidatus Didemnitutus sp.]|nr:response regulator [Candidatus Didemnitutus sp.]